MNAADIEIIRLAAGYLLLLIPLGVILWYRVPLLNRVLMAVVRMSTQLLLVGLYLQVIFKRDNIWLTGAWLVIMVGVADISIIRGCRLRWRRFALPLFGALVGGTVLPLFFFMGVILKGSDLMEAQYVIPIGGMILGNCLRVNIIGVRSFYEGIRLQEKVYLHSLAQGARLSEAVRPFLSEACQAALSPMVATMATVGLVSLPGMMTGVILGGANPMTAIKYQIAIIIAIFTGTAITVVLGIWLTIKNSFTAYGILDKSIFQAPAKG